MRLTFWRVVVCLDNTIAGYLLHRLRRDPPTTVTTRNRFGRPVVLTATRRSIPSVSKHAFTSMRVRYPHLAKRAVFCTAFVGLPQTAATRGQGVGRVVERTDRGQGKVSKVTRMLVTFVASLLVVLVGTAEGQIRESAERLIEAAASQPETEDDNASKWSGQSRYNRFVYGAILLAVGITLDRSWEFDTCEVEAGDCRFVAWTTVFTVGAGAFLVTDATELLWSREFSAKGLKRPVNVGVSGATVRVSW